MNTLVHTVAATIERRQLLARGSHVLVAVSGGVDSIALLEVLHQLSSDRDWRLAIAHFNHQLRGRSSDADERFVGAVSKRLNLPFISESADVRAMARQERLSIEMAARDLRHAFLARAARSIGAPTVALAHHADDQAELFLLRLLRGSGPAGLGGMRWRSPSPSDRGVVLIRPFLDVSKSAIHEYAKASGLKFREDASNRLLEARRNRVRHEVLPVLRDIQPSITRTILRSMDLGAAETEVVQDLALDWLSKRKPAFAKLPLAVRRWCVQLQARGQGIDLEFDQVETLLNEPAGLLPFSKGTELKMERDGTLRITAPRTTEGFRSGSRRIDLAKERSAEFGGKRFSWEIIERPGAKRSQTSSGEEFDADKVGRTVELRFWRAGDRFHPIGMNRAVKLQDLFTNLKVPRGERFSRILACTAAGEIFWVEGLRMSEGFKLDNQSTRRLKWQW